MANGYNSRRNTSRGARNAMNRVGRPTRAAGAIQSRASLTGRGNSTRMARGRVGSSSLIANSNTNRIVAQRSRMPSSPASRNLGGVAGRSTQVPSSYKLVRMERPNFEALGKPRYRLAYCPPGQNTFTHECKEVDAGATTSPIAQTSNIRGMTRGMTRGNTNGRRNGRRQTPMRGMSRGGGGGRRY